MLLAEVCGAVVRALLPDERRVQATALGAGLFAYEVPGDAAVFEEDLAHREPQTLTQIQRMVVTCECRHRAVRRLFLFWVGCTFFVVGSLVKTKDTNVMCKSEIKK